MLGRAELARLRLADEHRWLRDRSRPPHRSGAVEDVLEAFARDGFVVLPRRWVVERTFSWFGRNRRLAKDFENLAESLLAFVTLACIQIAIRRLAR